MRKQYFIHKLELRNMRENKLADLSMDLAVKVMKVCDGEGACCKCSTPCFYSAISQAVFSGQSVVSKWVRMAREKYSSFSHRAGRSA